MKNRNSLIYLKFLFLMSFIMGMYLNSLAQFTLQEVSINGDNINAIKKKKYTYLYGQFETHDGVNYKIVIYAQRGKRDPVDITGNFTHISQHQFNFPCVFGNIKWRVRIPRKINSSHSYNLVPEDPNNDGGHIHYHWVANGTAPQILSQLNPVPPRSAQLTLLSESDD